MKIGINGGPESDFCGSDVIRFFLSPKCVAAAVDPALLLQRMDESRRRNDHLKSQNFNKRPTPRNGNYNNKWICSFDFRRSGLPALASVQES